MASSHTTLDLNFRFSRAKNLVSITYAKSILPTILFIGLNKKKRVLIESNFMRLNSF